MPRIEPQKPDQTFNRSRERQREVLAYLGEERGQATFLVPSPRSEHEGIYGNCQKSSLSPFLFHIRPRLKL